MEHTRFEQFVGRQIIVDFSTEETDTESGVLREISPFGLLLETSQDKGLYFYPWNVVHGIDLSQAYSQMGRAA